MELEFEKPIVPNFIRTKTGTFSVEKLTEEELTKYAELWVETLRERYEKKR